MSHHVTKDMIEFNRHNASKIADICEPLFSTFGFHSFGYTRIQKNGNRIVLETNKEWLEYYAQIDFHEKDEGNNSLIHNISRAISAENPQEFYVKVLTGEPKTKLHECLFTLDLWNSLSIYVNMNQFVEVYHLSTPKSNTNTMEFCFNNKELLQRFFHFFREKIHDLNIEKAPYIVDNEFSKVFNTEEINSHKDSTGHSKVQEYLKQTNVEKFYLKTHDRFISRREAECLHYLALGKSCKETARILKISPRTVESYINVLKNKTSAHSKMDLVNIAHQNYISKFNFYDVIEKTNDGAY